MPYRYNLITSGVSMPTQPARSVLTAYVLFFIIVLRFFSFFFLFATFLALNRNVAQASECLDGLFFCHDRASASHLVQFRM